MKTVDCLKAARAAIVRYGWTQRYLGDERVGYCAIGAIHRVTDRVSRRRDAVDILRAVLGLDGKSTLANWNDVTGRTKRQVLAAFSRAIKNSRRG